MPRACKNSCCVAPKSSMHPGFKDIMCSPLVYPTSEAHLRMKIANIYGLFPKYCDAGGGTVGGAGWDNRINPLQRTAENCTQDSKCDPGKTLEELLYPILVRRIRESAQSLIAATPVEPSITSRQYNHPYNLFSLPFMSTVWLWQRPSTIFCPVVIYCGSQVIVAVTVPKLRNSY